MLELVTMQTELLDSYAIFALIASVLVQGLAAFFMLRLWIQDRSRTIPRRFFILGIGSLIFLAAGAVLAVIQPSLFLVSSGIFLASLTILLLSLLAKVPTVAPPAQETVSEQVEQVIQAEKQDDPLIAVGQLFLSHVAETLTGELNIVRLLDYINETMISHTGADGGVVFLADDFEDIISAKSFSGKFPPPYKLPADLPHKPVRVETNFRYVQFNLGETIFGEVASSGKAQLIVDGSTDNRIHANGPEDFLRPGSYIFVPLMVKDRVVGVSGMARLPENRPFTEEDFRVAKVLAGYSGSAVNNVYSVQEILEHADLEREASIASKIQKTLHPKRLPDLPEVGFGSIFNATKGVCGDYFDIILARRDRIALVVADVAGKGIQSSMVMIMLRSILHLVTNTTKTGSTILDWVNKGITGKIDLDHYATLAFVLYNPAKKTVEYATAGHQSMLIWRESSGKIEQVSQKTDPIGVERNSQYADIKLTVSKGDIIILYTDGLIEALNREGRQYGIKTLSSVIAEHHTASAKEIANEVKHNIQTFLGSASLHDDQTLVLMKIKA